MGYGTLAKKALAEFLGTLLLTFSILSAITSTDSTYNQIVFVHGFAIFNLGLIFGPISGGHFNPAVTFSFLLKKSDRIPVVDFAVYSLVQLFGGFVAGCLNYGFWQEPYYIDSNSSNSTGPGPGPLGNSNGDNSYVACFFAEVVGTMLLVLAVRVSGCKKNSFIRENNNFFGVLVIAGMLTYVGFMGLLYYAGVNPAREFGPRLAGAIFYGADAFTSYAWIPIVGPFVGSVFGVALFLVIDRLYENSMSQNITNLEDM